MGGRLVGVAQFGPPMDRSKLIGLVRDTPWNSMLELNRLAMIDDTPKNTESRFLAVCFRLIRKNAPHVQWVVSFADGTQCGDGTIYRAAGFVLTGIKRNTQIWEMPAEVGGARVSRTAMTAQGPKGASAQKREVFSRMVATDTRRVGRDHLLSRTTVTKGSHIRDSGAASMRPFVEAGARPLPGFQLRYLYFIDPTARGRLTVPVLPFSEIDRLGAGMYLGHPRVRSIDSDAPASQAGEGGAIPTRTLHPASEGDL